MGDRAAQRFTQLGSENWGDKDNSNKRMQMLTVNSAQYVRNFIMQHSETAGRVTDLLGVFTQLSVWDWDDNNLLGSHSWRHHNTLQPRIAAVNHSTRNWTGKRSKCIEMACIQKLQQSISQPIE